MEAPAIDPTELEAIARGHFGKKQYSTRGLAERVAQRCEGERGQKLKVYHCGLCNQFHLAKDRS